MWRNGTREGIFRALSNSSQSVLQEVTRSMRKVLRERRREVSNSSQGVGSNKEDEKGDVGEEGGSFWKSFLYFFTGWRS